MFTLQPTPSAISTVPWSAGALIDRLPTLEDINNKGKLYLKHLLMGYRLVYHNWLGEGTP